MQRHHPYGGYDQDSRRGGYSNAGIPPQGRGGFSAGRGAGRGQAAQQPMNTENYNNAAMNNGVGPVRSGAAGRGRGGSEGFRGAPPPQQQHDTVHIQRQLLQNNNYNSPAEAYPSFSPYNGQNPGYGNGIGLYPEQSNGQGYGYPPSQYDDTRTGMQCSPSCLKQRPPIIAKDWIRKPTYQRKTFLKAILGDQREFSGYCLLYRCITSPFSPSLRLRLHRVSLFLGSADS